MRKTLLLTFFALIAFTAGAWAKGELNGVFTINAAGDRILFSKGNLQQVNGTWQFAEHQYDYFGTNQYSDHYDWFAYNGYSAPSDGTSWYILSQAEWAYLFESRTVTNTLSEGALYSKATIGGTYKGVIVFPDNYTHPNGTDFTGNCNNPTEAYSSTVSLEGWALMEAAGCVFLPAAGYSTSPGQVNQAAIYQSTTLPRSGYCNTPGFYIDYMAMTDESKTSTRVAVRYVKKYELTQDADGYYLLGSAQDLKEFALLVNSGTNAANAKMTANINLAGGESNQWTPIGTDANRYIGTFDGQGFTISNLYYKRQVQGVGLFGYANSGAYIKNVRVEGMIDNSTDGAGAGTGTNTSAGGILGVSSGAIILNCSFSGSVISHSNVGGIVGSGGTAIANCYNEGTVIFHSTQNQTGGGIHGSSSGGYVQLHNCYNVGDIINNGGTTSSIGALSLSGDASNCYSRSGCAQNGNGASWGDAYIGNNCTAMSADDMKAETFVTTLNANVPSLRVNYPDICEWTLNSNGYPVHANKKMTYTVPASGVGSFSSNTKVQLPDGLTAYYCKEYDSTNGIIAAVPLDNGVIPANTGVLIRGEAGAYTLSATNATAATVEDNALVAVTEATHVDATCGQFTNFMLSSGKFIKIAASSDPNVKMPANKAYLQLALGNTSSKEFTLLWDEDPTAIKFESSEVRKSESIYDLQGRKVANPVKGRLYIINGKVVKY